MQLSEMQVNEVLFNKNQVFHLNSDVGLCGYVATNCSNPALREKVLVVLVKSVP